MSNKKAAHQTASNTEGRVRIQRVDSDVSYKPSDKKTPFGNFEDLTDKLLRVPKKEVDKLRKQGQARKQD